jgi:NUDIX domain
MSRTRRSIQFVVGVIVVGIAINLVSDYLGNHYKAAEGPLIIAGLAGVAIWLLIIITDISYTRLTAGRYAVEALILNEQDELLLYRHPFHRCMLPPGGRVGRSEFPNEALRLRLQERLNLSPHQYRFDERFHQTLNANSGNLGDAQRLPAPYIVQREIHKQRAFVQLHYDFIYVLRLQPYSAIHAVPNYEPVRFVDVETLKDMVSQGSVFPDVLDAYRRILQVVTKEVQ